MWPVDEREAFNILCKTIGDVAFINVIKTYGARTRRCLFTVTTLRDPNCCAREANCTDWQASCTVSLPNKALALPPAVQIPLQCAAQQVYSARLVYSGFNCGNNNLLGRRAVKLLSVALGSNKRWPTVLEKQQQTPERRLSVSTNLKLIHNSSGWFWRAFP